MATVNERDPRAYHPHRADGLDKNLTRLNEADFESGFRCTCDSCCSLYEDSRQWKARNEVLAQINDYPIGTQYKTRGKHPNVCTVTDVLKTYNSKGELVKTRYVSVHRFMGQTVTNHDVPGASIAMGLVTNGQ